MPKINSIQTGFQGGEFSPMLYGQVKSDRFKTGLQTCLNYIPTLQGPLVRRPGTKYVCNVKDSTKPPALVEFKFSTTQAYVFEVGDRYIRFFTNNGQVVTSSNSFRVHGWYNTAFDFYGVRSDAKPGLGENILDSSVIAAGSVLELASPYLASDVQKIKYCQRGDTVYLTHQNYPPYKLQRKGTNLWELHQIYFIDGPYLPLNSYKDIADSVGVQLIPNNTSVGTLSAGPIYTIIHSTSALASGAIRLTTSAAHGKSSGNKVFISGVSGATEANNTVAVRQWTIDVVDSTSFDLRGTTAVNALVGSTGLVYPAIFQYDSNNAAYDTWFTGTSAVVYSGRNFGLISDKDNTGAAAAPTRVWGEITGILNAGQAIFRLTDDAGTGFVLPNTSVITYWQMGSWSRQLGFPSAACFHQDRLGFVGATANPQQVNLSEPGLYERFAASQSSIVLVTDANAIQFNLNSTDQNQLFWVKSSQQSLITGSYSSEWAVSPNTQGGVLTPTNVSASQTSYFGSADVDSVQAGNAALYVQRAGRKVREMNYFFNVGTYRSTDLTEIAEHITLPSITKLAVQKETLPLVWAVRSDGILAAMSYNRDDQTIKAGWARHQLGGQSDSGGTNPLVKSIACIPATANSSSFDQLWMVVQRSTVSGSTFTSIEYMTKPYDDSFVQADAFQGDCGATYDSPINVVDFNYAYQFPLDYSTLEVTATAHGLANGDQVRINDAVGLNLTTVDVNSTAVVTNLVNNKTFIVGSVATNTFLLQDFNGNFIATGSASVWTHGGTVRKMVKTISGLNWLNGETVGVLADGGIHPDVVVQSGAITLNFRAAKVQIGYRYNSDGANLNEDGGSAQGSAIGEIKRITRVAVQMHNIGDFQMGSDFSDLHAAEFQQADQQLADQATPLYSGFIRDSIGAPYSFEANVCWRQNSMLPGMIQSITGFMEVQDV